MPRLPAIGPKWGIVLLLLAQAAGASAQRIDSVHVFKELPPGRYTTSSAHTTAWRLHRDKAPFTGLRGGELTAVGEALAEYKPVKHMHGALDGLGHLAMVFSGGRPLVFGITGDLDRVINLTARTEYRISGWAGHMRVRALLLRLLVEH